jgi:Domain of unknown function (DUF4349)
MKTGMKIAAGIALLAVAVAAAVFSVGGGAGDGQSGGGGSATPEIGDQVVRNAFEAPDGARGAERQATAPPRSASRLPTVGPSVIKTGDLRVRVPNGEFRQSVEDVVSIAGRYPGGFVLSTSIGGGEARLGTIVIRVPARSFERALTDLEALGQVRSESVTGQDVTQEFIDLEARLRNSRSQEAVLLRLMDEASTVTDTIRVQGELESVQLEIERLTGQLRYLEDQTSLGTLTVSLVEAGAAPKPAGTLQRAWKQALENTLGVVAAVIVGAGVAIPVAVLVLVALVIVRQLRPRLTS